MFQNANWFRVTAFVVVYMGLMAVVVTTGILGLLHWMAGAVVLFRKPLQHWFGFRNRSEVLTDPQQIQAARSQEKIGDTVALAFACIAFGSGLILILVQYNILR
ncbi:MAG: hypothetical protein AAGF95_24860 [Chloroflexota bacterium]